MQVGLISIGEFARRSRLSPKALRLYDGLGLLTPARVDDDFRITTSSTSCERRFLTGASMLASGCPRRTSSRSAIARAVRPCVGRSHC